MLLKRLLDRDYQWSEINANIIKKNNATGGAPKSVQQDLLTIFSFFTYFLSRDENFSVSSTIILPRRIFSNFQID